MPEEKAVQPRGLRRLGNDISFSAICAGFIAMAVSYAGPMLVILQAAQRAGLSEAQSSSWVWAVSVGSGITGLLLSLFTRQPIIVAWSVPGAALLLTVLGDYSYSEAIGAYIVAGLLGLLLSLSGLLGWLLARVPKPVLAAVLAGVLLPFVMEVVQAVLDSPLIAGGLVAAYFLARRWSPGYAVPVALCAGIALAAGSGQISNAPLSFMLTSPVFTVPAFSLSAIMGISLPLLIVTMAGQNGPGLTMLRSSNYRPNDRLLLSGGSLASILFAPFGSHAINLAAITAGICTSAQAHRDPARRYVAGISCGAFFIFFGLFSQTFLQLFAAVPAELVIAVAGVALLPAMQGSMQDMFDGPASGAAEAAVCTLIITASGVAPLGIVSPFWGIAGGTLCYLALHKRRPAYAAKGPNAAVPSG